MSDINENTRKAIRGTVGLVIPSAEKRKAYRFPQNITLDDDLAVLAEEEKNRRLAASPALLNRPAKPQLSVGLSALAKRLSPDPPLAPAMAALAARLSPKPVTPAIKPEPDPLNPPKPMPRNLLDLALRLAPTTQVKPEPNPLDPKPAAQVKPKPDPLAPAATPDKDLVARRAAFAKELKASARTGGYDPAKAAEQARSLNISPEDFARFAKRESLGDLQAQQERQMVNPIGSSSALNLRRGLETEAGRLLRMGKRYGIPQLVAEGAARKADTPGIRTQDQRIAEQQGQEQAANAFQANEDQYAAAMKQMAGDPRGRKMLDKWMKNQAKAS